MVDKHNIETIIDKATSIATEVPITAVRKTEEIVGYLANAFTHDEAYEGPTWNSVLPSGEEANIGPDEAPTPSWEPGDPPSIDGLLPAEKIALDALIALVESIDNLPHGWDWIHRSSFEQIEAGILACVGSRLINY